MQILLELNDQKKSNQHIINEEQIEIHFLNISGDLAVKHRDLSSSPRADNMECSRSRGRCQKILKKLLRYPWARYRTHKCSDRALR